MALGTKRKASNILSKQPLDLPPGTIHAFAGTTAPEKWAMCDGSEVSKTQYAALYAVIGDIYGTPVDSNNFVLPDLRGEFLRGLDDMGTAAGARGKDVDGTARTVGQTQANATSVNGISVTESYLYQFETDYDNSNANGAANNEAAAVIPTNGWGDWRHTGNGSGPRVAARLRNLERNAPVSSTDTETRPANMAINYIIKL